MHAELSKNFFIEAAHRAVDSDESVGRLHGHSFCVVVSVEGEVQPGTGWLIDFGEIKRAFAPLEKQLDHHFLNEVPGMDDASLGGIAAWIEARLRPALPLLKSVYVCIAGDNAFRPVTLPADDGRGLPERIRFSFEAAQSLPHLPAEHPCNRLHGHSYRVEVGASDLARLTRHLRELYELLDHRYLNELAELNEATSERLCEWIWSRLAQRLDDLTVVVVQETETSRCTYRGK